MPEAYFYALPSVDEAREFLRLINVGRKAAGFVGIDRLDFDSAVPSNPHSCLSATNLFHEAGFRVMDEFISGSTEREYDERVPAALDMEDLGPTAFRTHRYALPDAIRRVTDPFDAELEGLEERLSEAGVI